MKQPARIAATPHAHTEFQTRAFEDLFICTLCGYWAWTRTLTDRKRSAADLEGWRSFPRRKDGLLAQRSSERNGFGACCLSSFQGVASLYSFHMPLHPTEKQEPVAAARTGRAADKELDPSQSHLTASDEAINKVLLIAGTLPHERCET